MAEKDNNWFKRHKILTVVLVIIGLAVIGSALNGNSDTGGGAGSEKQSDTKKADDNKAKTAKIGEPARDGQFEFSIKSVKCNKPSVTDSSGYVTKTAQGQYCLMTLNVKNIGDKQQYFSESDQKLLNESGQQYSTDVEATLTNSNSSDVFLAQINPGNSVKGVLVFDIPKGEKPVTAELHDSAFSGGIKVDLK